MLFSILIRLLFALLGGLGQVFSQGENDFAAAKYVISSLKIFNMADIPVRLFRYVEGNRVEILDGNLFLNNTSVMIDSFEDQLFEFKSASDDVRGDVVFKKAKPHEAIVLFTHEKEIMFHKAPFKSRDELKHKTGISILSGSHRPSPSHIEAMNGMTWKERFAYSSQHCASLGRGSADFYSCFSQFAHDDIWNSYVEPDRAFNAVLKSMNFMARRLRDYVCDDGQNVPSSAPLYTEMITVKDHTYEANVLLYNDSAKIWTVPNFITDGECRHLEEATESSMKRSSVMLPNGTMTSSLHRKAFDAGYEHHLLNYNKSSYNYNHNSGNDNDNDSDSYGDGSSDIYQNSLDPMVHFHKRILEMTNRFAGYELLLEGQEGLTVIRYDPKTSDEYTPHCDGSCSGAPHKNGGRVATAIFYCKIPRKGGGTTFTFPNFYVKPVKHMGLFFTYKGSDGSMNGGLTEHSGCPVLDGEKLIVTAFMRDGVSVEFPHTLTDPAGRPHSAIVS